LDAFEAFFAFFNLAFDRFEGGFFGAEGFGDADFAGDGDEVILLRARSRGFSSASMTVSLPILIGVHR
jgi:hypothetical protein